MSNNTNNDVDSESSIPLETSFQSFVFPIHNSSLFFHNELHNKDKLFVGRSTLRLNLKGALEDSESGGGCFLVGGYRGVGKSMLVKKVVDGYIKEQKNKKKYIELNLNIGDAKILSFRGIITDSISLLREKLQKEIKEGMFNVAARIFLLSVAALALTYLTKDKASLNLFSGFSFDWKIVPILVYFSIFLILFNKIIIHDHLSKESYRHEEPTNLAENQIGLSTDTVQKILVYIPIIIISAYIYILYFSDISSPLFPYIPGIIQIIINSIFLIFNWEKIGNYIQRIKLTRKLFSLHRSAIFDEYKEIIGDVSSPIGKLTNKVRMKRDVLSDRELENRFAALLNEYSNVIKVIFIFDELDKLSDKKGGKRDLIDSFLSRMKAFLKTPSCRFIFIGDREIVDNYHSESGSKNALYEGIFDQIFYVPSLLSDYSDRRPDVLHSMVMEYVLNILMSPKMTEDFYTDKGYAKISPNSSYNSVVERSKKMQEAYLIWALSSDEQWQKLTSHDSSKSLEKDTFTSSQDFKNLQYILNRFVRFLTIHSWGNYRRLVVLINQFVEQGEKENTDRHGGQCAVDTMKFRQQKKYLHIDKKEMTRILLAANLYEMIAWEMTPKLTESDDKLVISTINSAIDLIKFHEVPFSRSYLDRTAEGIDIHAEPHLTGSIEDIIDRVNYPFIRKIKRGLFEYRFFSQHEEEIRYISKTVGAKASNYVFGLSSYDNVKSFYQSQLDRYLGKSKINNSGQARAVIEMILGDINTWERSYDKAYSHYSDSVSILKGILRTPDGTDWRHNGGPSFSSHYLLVRVLLKKGLILEIRNSITAAWRFYREALDVAQKSFGDPIKSTLTIDQILRKIHDKGDVRHRDVLVLSILALNTVYLKSNQVQRREIDSIELKLKYRKLITDVGTGSARLTETNGDSNQLGQYSCFTTDVDKEIIYQTQIVRFFANDFENITEEMNPVIEGFLYEHGYFQGKKIINDGDFVTSLVFVTWAQSNFILQIEKVLSISTPETKKQHLYNILFPKIDTSDEKTIEVMLSKHKVTIESFSLEDDSFSILSYFKLFDIIAKSLVELGYKVRASHIYSNIILSYLAVMESFPWEDEELFKNISDGNEDSNARLNSSFLNYFLKQHAKCNQIHDQGLYKFQKDSWEHNDTPSLQEIRPTNKRYGAGFKNRLTNELSNKKNLTFWHHSHAKNLNLIMSFWYMIGENRLQHLDESTRERSISDLNFMRDIDVHTVLPQYQKNLSTLFWLKGRYHLYYLLENRENCSKQQQNDDLLTSILYFYKAHELSLKVLGSGGVCSWPPQSIVLYNLLQALEVAADVVSEESSMDLVYKLEKMLFAKVPRNFLDYRTLYILTIQACDDLNGLGNKGSAFYLQQLKHKYFLYDDFKDPIFKIEWMFLHILKVGASEHKERSKKIYEKLNCSFKSKQ